MSGKGGVGKSSVSANLAIALACVRKSINFCKAVGMFFFGFVENMSGYAGVSIQEKFADSPVTRAFGEVVEIISNLTSN